jgi:hypothetical protein
MGTGWFSTRDKTSWTSFGSGTKASKNPSAAKRPTVQAVQYVQPFKSLKGLRTQKMVPIQTFLVQKIVEDLEAAQERFREIAADLTAGS